MTQVHPKDVYFEGNPLGAKSYLDSNKLELLIPDSPRDNSEILGISDVIDLMVVTAVIEGLNSYRLGVDFKDDEGNIVPLSVTIYWAEHEAGFNRRPLRNFAGFHYYHVSVSITPLSEGDNLIILEDFLLNPLIRFTNYESLSLNTSLN